MSACFSHMIFYVPKVDEAVSLFKKAFGMEVRFVHESGAYAEMETGATALAFVSEELAHSNLPQGHLPHDPKKPPFACEIVLTFQDVQAAFEKAVKAGCKAIAQPEEKPWGQTVAYVREPQGILIELASPCSV